MPDEQLVRDCLIGRDAAWSALIRRYKTLIFSIPVRYGHIFMQSEPGHGTTFKIYLPTVEDAVRSDSPAPSDASVRRRDHPSGGGSGAVRESAAEYLAENGYTVLKASVGSEALEIAKRRKQPIHLLLTDVVMPQMSGRELSEKITRIHPETKVIFMSGYSNNLLSNQQVLDPKHELVQKPFRLTTLGRRIREILTCGLAAGAGK